MTKPLPKEIVYKIREEVLKGKSKYRVAKEMGLNEYVVYSHTADLPSISLREPCIKGKTLELLQQLLRDGYVNSNLKTSYHLRRLKRFLPMIQRAQIEGKGIYYLDDKNKLALQAMIKRNISRIISYQELARMSRVFNIDLSNEEKHSFLGKRERRVVPIIRRKEGGFMSSLKKNQLKLDDFISETGFFRKNMLKNRRKNQHVFGSSLLENDDSFVDFCIRNYCNTGHSILLYKSLGISGNTIINYGRVFHTFFTVSQNVFYSLLEKWWIHTTYKLPDRKKPLTKEFKCRSCHYSISLGDK